MTKCTLGSCIDGGDYLLGSHALCRRSISRDLHRLLPGAYGQGPVAGGTLLLQEFAGRYSASWVPRMASRVRGRTIEQSPQRRMLTIAMSFGIPDLPKGAETGLTEEGFRRVAMM